MELEEWIRGIKKIFAITEAPREKKANIRMFYFAAEANFSWYAMKNRLIGP